MTSRSDLVVALPASVIGANPLDEALPQAAVQVPREPSWLRLIRLKTCSDEELMCEMKSGSAEALTVLFGRHARLVWRVAYRILRDAGEAEEAVQQVFLDIFRNYAQFDPRRGGFHPWLLTIS